jgi:hypothetical protein
MRDTGIVDHHAHRAEGCLSKVEPRADRVVIAHIHRHHHGLSAKFQNRVHPGFKALRIVAGKRKPCTIHRQRPRHGEPHSGATTRHQNNLFGHIEQFACQHHPPLPATCNKRYSGSPGLKPPPAIPSTGKINAPLVAFRVFFLIWAGAASCKCYG